MRRKVRWTRDVSGRHVEVVSDGQPLPAIPDPELGQLSCRANEWSYRKGEVTAVKVVDGSDTRPYEFVDVARGHIISGIAQDAFEFVS